MLNPLSRVVYQIGGADSQAELMRSKTGAAEDKLEVSGNKYFISTGGNDLADGKTPETAWRSLERLWQANSELRPGDGVFFERGSVFRQESTDHPELWRNNAVLAVSGVTYAAYGEGRKPEFLGSSFNYAECEWKNHSGFIWQTRLPLQDAGVMAFDDDAYVGIKKSSLDELEFGNDFYHDTDNGILYLYSENGNPGQVYKDIEIGCDRPVFLFCGGAGDIRIDNISIKYVGAHAISGYENNTNITITNCEIGFVGGSWQEKGVVHYGNAVQFWDNCSEIEISDCYVYRIYDAGLTFQGPKGAVYRNIRFINNLIEYYNYGIEFFIQGPPDIERPKTKGILENIDFSGNIMRFAGYGICEQRPYLPDASHICGWGTDVGEGVKNFSIKNNIFDISAYSAVFWLWEEKGDCDISENEFYMRKEESDFAMRYGLSGLLRAENEEELKAAVNSFDRAPKLVKWINNN